MGTVPVPVNKAVTVPALVLTSTRPVIGPMMVGENITVKVQLEPGEICTKQFTGVA